MAYQSPQWALAGVVATADLSDNQFYCVKKNATDNQYALCDTDGEVFDGVLQNKTSAAGREATIMALGITMIVAGEALTAGDLWGTDSAGKAKQLEGSHTGADVGDFVMGRVVQGAASGAIATVTVGIPSYKIEAVA